MKANQNTRSLRDSQEAVSPVIAVILMVAITVVLAATVFVLVADLGGEQSIAPTMNLNTDVDHANDQITLKHVSGERLFSGDWRLSIQPASSGSNVFITCTTDFEVGDTLTFATQTDSPAVCDASGITGGTALADGDYQVVLIHIPSQTTLLDQTIQIA